MYRQLKPGQRVRVNDIYHPRCGQIGVVESIADGDVRDELAYIDFAIGRREGVFTFRLCLAPYDQEWCDQDQEGD